MLISGLLAADEASDKKHTGRTVTEHGSFRIITDTYREKTAEDRARERATRKRFEHDIEHNPIHADVTWFPNDIAGSMHGVMAAVYVETVGGEGPRLEFGAMIDQLSGKIAGARDVHYSSTGICSRLLVPIGEIIDFDLELRANILALLDEKAGTNRSSLLRGSITLQPLAWWGKYGGMLYGRAGFLSNQVLHLDRTGWTTEVGLRL